ncbi:MAG: recombination protein RecR [Hyphomicrobiaceae bacterium]|nr:recombination protein RecR [Hyphomicrobiaceae bacterium]
MSKKLAGPEIERVVQLLARLPGLGHRSARKAVLTLLKRRQDLLIPLSDALRVAADKLVDCAECGNIDTVSPCTVCADPRRDRSTIVVVEDVSDLWALERADAVKGLYHVLGGHLSPLDGIGPEALNIPRLIERAHAPEVREIILALNVTVEGQSTGHYLMDALQGADVELTRLAQGVPVGGELDYLDEGTLAAAMRSRRKLE